MSVLGAIVIKGDATLIRYVLSIGGECNDSLAVLESVKQGLDLAVMDDILRASKYENLDVANYGFQALSWAVKKCC